MKTWDVVVAGAGPAGATCAMELAKHDLSVLVLDKDAFPRFHIGESLLPAAGVLTERLGITPTDDTFVFKRGAEFICEASGRSQIFDFSQALPGPQRHAWHVDRARFDALLADRASALGAVFDHDAKVREIQFEETHVDVRTDTRKVRARYFIDASGAGKLLATKFRSLAPFRNFGKSAVFTHYESLSDDALQEIGPETNDIRVMIVPDGWAWIIPLPGRRLSIGLASRLKGLNEKAFDTYLSNSPLIQRLTAGATRLGTQHVGNFSCKNTRPFGSRYACVGDAACFIDPLFSSGVSLALTSALSVVDQLIPALQNEREADPRLMSDVETTLERGYATFGALVERFYNTRFAQNMILSAPEDGKYRAGMISVLAGDVFRDDNPLQDMLLSSRRKQHLRTVDAADNTASTAAQEGASA